MRALRNLFICASLFMPFKAMAEFGTAPNPESEPEVTFESEEFYPETTNQELAYVYTYVSNNNPTSMPCHDLALTYKDGFPGSVTNATYTDGNATSAQWQSSKFIFIHNQHHYGEKSYYKPVMFGFTPKDRWIKKELEKQNISEGNVTGEKEQELDRAYYAARDQFVKDYPDGKHVGWFKYRVTEVDEPLDIEQTPGSTRTPKHLAWYKANRFVTLRAFEDFFATAETEVKPIIYKKSLQGGSNGRTIIQKNYAFTEICTLAGMKYVEGDYTDLYNAELARRSAYQFFPAPLPPAKYKHLPNESPTIMAYWDNIGWMLKSEEEQLAMVETTMQIAKMPAYFVPLVGTGLSFVDALECKASGESHCWSTFAADAASDVAIFLKVPGVAAKIAKGIAKVTKVADPLKDALKASEKMDLYITGVNKFANLAMTASGATNGVLAAIYIKEGKIIEGVGRGLVGSTDLGIFLHLKKSLTFIPFGKVKQAACESVDKLKRTVKKVTSNIKDIAGCKISNRSYFRLGCNIAVPRISCN